MWRPPFAATSPVKPEKTALLVLQTAALVSAAMVPVSQERTVLLALLIAEAVPTAETAPAGGVKQPQTALRIAAPVPAVGMASRIKARQVWTVAAPARLVPAQSTAAGPLGAPALLPAAEALKQEHVTALPLQEAELLAAGLPAKPAIPKVAL